MIELMEAPECQTCSMQARLGRPMARLATRSSSPFARRRRRAMSFTASRNGSTHVAA
jgi:hypothetical protein